MSLLKNNRRIIIIPNEVKVLAIVSGMALWLATLVGSTKLITSGPVSAWMDDRLREGKPSRYVTSQLGRLSLPPSVGW